MPEIGSVLISETDDVANVLMNLISVVALHCQTSSTGVEIKKFDRSQALVILEDRCLVTHSLMPPLGMSWGETPPIEYFSACEHPPSVMVDAAPSARISSVFLSDRRIPLLGRIP